MDTPLSQSQLIEHIQSAIVARDLEQVKSLAPRINWMHQYRRDWLTVEQGDADIHEHSLLQYFETQVFEQDKSNSRSGNKAWRSFCEHALDVMVANGYRILDDTYQDAIITQQVDLMPVIAKVCHEHKMRGDCGETPLHLAARQIPFLEGMKGSHHPLADINALNDEGQTAFHIMWLENEVSQGGYGKDAWSKTAQWLLDRGADPYLPDVSGRTGMDNMAGFIERSDDMRRLRPLAAIFSKLQAELDARTLSASTPASKAPARRSTL